jgi:hypothetical protein
METSENRTTIIYLLEKRAASKGNDEDIKFQNMEMEI